MPTRRLEWSLDHGEIQCKHNTFPNFGSNVETPQQKRNCAEGQYLICIYIGK